ncbi:MAG: hypothetical protein ACMVO3_14560 [Thalassobaculum sp.]
MSRRVASKFSSITFWADAASSGLLVRHILGAERVRIYSVEEAINIEPLIRQRLLRQLQHRLRNRVAHRLHSTGVLQAEDRDRIANHRWFEVDRLAIGRQTHELAGRTPVTEPDELGHPLIEMAFKGKPEIEHRKGRSVADRQDPS